MRRVTAMEGAAGRERKGLREAARADTLTRLSLKLARRPSTAPTRSLNSRGTGGGWMSVVQAVHGGRANAKAVSMLREIRVMASTRCLQTHTAIVLCARSDSIPSPSLSLSLTLSPSLVLCETHTHANSICTPRRRVCTSHRFESTAPGQPFSSSSMACCAQWHFFSGTPLPNHLWVAN